MKAGQEQKLTKTMKSYCYSTSFINNSELFSSPAMPCDLSGGAGFAFKTNMQNKTMHYCIYRNTNYELLFQ